MTNPFPSMEMVERAAGRRVRERLSTNENEFGPARDVVRAIAEAAGEAHRYPDCDHFALRRRLGAALDTDPDLVRIGSGIDGLLGEVCRAFLGPGRTAVTSAATYPTFGYFARASGAELHLARYLDDHVDGPGLARLARETGADAVYVAEPDNPTGTALGRRALLDLADALPRHTLLVVDGAYAEYQDPADRLRVPDVLGRRLVWLRTFSKAHALAGMRVGYVLAAADLLAALAERAEHYVVGRVAEAAALAALDATSHLDEVVARTAEGRAHYVRALGDLGLTVLPGSANFVTARCPAAEPLARELMARGIAVRHLTAPSVDDCVRVTIGPREQREAVLAAVAAFVHDVHETGAVSWPVPAQK